MTQYESMFEVNFEGAENEPDQGYVLHIFMLKVLRIFLSLCFPFEVLHMLKP